MWNLLVRYSDTNVLKEPLVIIRSNDGTCNFIRNFRASLPNYARHM